MQALFALIQTIWCCGWVHGYINNNVVEWGEKKEFLNGVFTGFWNLLNVILKKNISEHIDIEPKMEVLIFETH